MKADSYTKLRAESAVDEQAKRERFAYLAMNLVDPELDMTCRGFIQLLIARCIWFTDESMSGPMRLRDLALVMNLEIDRIGDVAKKAHRLGYVAAESRPGYSSIYHVNPAKLLSMPSAFSRPGPILVPSTPPVWTPGPTPGVDTGTLRGFTTFTPHESEKEEPAASPPDASIDSEPEAMGDSKATAAARGAVEGVDKYSAKDPDAKPKKKKTDGDDPPPTDGANLLFRLYLGLVNRVRPDFRGHDLLRRQLAGIEVELEKALPRHQWADYLDFANQKFGEMTDGKTLPVNNIVGRGKWIVDFATSGPRRVLSLDDVLKKLWYALGYRGDPRMPVNAAKKIMAGKPLSEISPDLREAAQWVVDHYAEFKTVRVDE